MPTSFESIKELRLEYEPSRRDKLWALYWRAKRAPKNTKRYVVKFYQRGMRGWSDEDTWDLYHYLGKTITESLTHFIGGLHGHPSELTDVEWEAILHKIVEGFDAQMRLAELEPPHELEVLKAQRDEAFDLLKEWWPHLWD